MHSPEAAKYTPDYAVWQRGCAKMWSPYFEKAGVQLVIVAHQHHFRYDPPAPGRSWAQIVGGGPVMKLSNEQEYPTVIHGRIENDKLHITVHNVRDAKVVFDSFI